MSLPWSEDELLTKLRPLHCDDVAKFFATVIFKRPDLLRHLPDLTEQLRTASDISDPDQQLDVLDWIETTLPSPRTGVPSPRPGPWNKAEENRHSPLKPDLPAEVGDPLLTIPTDASAMERSFQQHRPAEEKCARGSLVTQTDNNYASGAGPISNEDINIDIKEAILEGEEDALEDALASGVNPFSHAVCILQFSTPVYYAKEGEDDEMILDVMRLGPDHEEVSCSFHTSDGDGKVGMRYKHTEGKLVFKPGEIMKQINVDIIESPAWSSSLEFKVVLHAASKCSLGRYLYACRVKVIDPDCFPSNKFQKQILSNNWQSVPMFKLLLDYFRFNYLSSPIVNRRTKHQLLTDQIANLYFILRLYIGKVVIDKILRQWKADDPGAGCNPYDGSVYFNALVACPDDPDSKTSKYVLLLISAAIIITPMFFIHLLDFNEVYFKIGGTSRKTLQGNLVRKFLNYDETARAQMGPSDLIMAMTRDTQSLVHDGYMQLFPLAQNLGKLVLMVALQLFMGARMAVLPVFVYPIFLGAFLVYRNKLIFRMSVEQDQAQNDMTNYATQVMTSYRLIGDYLRRPDSVEEVEKKVGTFNKRMIASDAVNCNNKYFCKYLALLCVAVWNVVGGSMVLAGHSEVGTFVTNLEVFNQVGQAWTIIFDVMLKMQSSLPYLEKIVTYMNLPIDLEKRMRANRKRRQMGEEARKDARLELLKAKREGRVPDGAFAADYVPISLCDVSFEYASPEKIYQRLCVKSSHNASLLALASQPDHPKDGKLLNCSMSFEQGALIALVGVPEEGKSTVMKLLGAEIIPDTGDLLIPPHLRALHVSPQPIFFNDTLLNNLTYGVSHGDDEDGNIERVIGICRKLKVSEAVIGYLDKATPGKYEVKADWGDVLNTTTRVLLNLARALIANPEILVVQKPTSVFDDAISENTLMCLREFVEKKGLLMDPKTMAFRRPRTCVMTTTRPMGMSKAHRIFKVNHTGVEELTGISDVRFCDIGVRHSGSGFFNPSPSAIQPIRNPSEQLSSVSSG